MNSYKIVNNRQKSVRENGNKHKSRSIVAYRNSNINPKPKNNYINYMNKEILRKRQEDQNLYNKKTSRNTKQKSIDNAKYNQNMYQNSSINYNNPSQYQKKSIKTTKKDKL